MARQFIALLLLGSWLGMGAIAQDPTVMPECALSCMGSALEQSTCAPNDTACVCQDPAINQAMGACMPVSCTAREALIATNLSTTQCGAPVRDRGDVVTTVALAGGIIALVCIMLRLLARPETGLNKLLQVEMLDDWTIVAVGIIMVPFIAVAVEKVKHGYGQDIWTISFDNIRMTILFLYVHQILYIFILAGTKMSIVFFYMRVFPVETMRGLRTILYVTLAVVIGFGVSFIFVLAFQCIPVNYLWDDWDKPPQGHCINVNAMGYSNASINLTIDIWLLLLPMPQLWKLKMPLKRKLSVCAMFAVGLFVTVVSIPRLLSVAEFAQTTNPTYDFVYVSFWAILEADVGVICACMPRIYVLFSRMYRKAYPPTHVTGSNPLTSQYPSRAGRTDIHKSSRGLQPIPSRSGPDSIESGSSKYNLCGDQSGMELDRISTREEGRGR